MKYLETTLKDCYVIEPRVFEDERGYFFESYNESKDPLSEFHNGWVQDNEAKSNKGVLRGLHFQKGDHAQAKLVRVIKGSVQDIVVDLRKTSPTFGQSYAIILNEDNKRQLFVPRGFAHGCLTLSASANVVYKCDNYYDKASEGGILYNDATLALDWHLPEEDIIISEKDKELPTFAEVFK